MAPLGRSVLVAPDGPVTPVGWVTPVGPVVPSPVAPVAPVSPVAPSDGFLEFPVGLALLVRPSLLEFLVLLAHLGAIGYVGCNLPLSTLHTLTSGPLLLFPLVSLEFQLLLVLSCSRYPLHTLYSLNSLGALWACCSYRSEIPCIP